MTPHISDESNHNKKPIGMIQRLLTRLSFNGADHDNNRLITCRLCDDSVLNCAFEEHTEACSKTQELLESAQRIDGDLQKLGDQLAPNPELSKLVQAASGLTGASTEIIIGCAKLQYRLTKLQLTASLDGGCVAQTEQLINQKKAIHEKLRRNSSDKNEPIPSPKRKGRLTVLLNAVINSLAKQPSNPLIYRLPSIDDFELLKPLSKGAFGSLYLTRHRKTGDLFALKAIRKADSSRKNSIAHGMTERRALSLINSPWIVSLYFAFETDSFLFLVMEYMIGGDLGALLKANGRLNNEQIVRFYGAELVAAVDTLHSSANIIHHDLKPENIVIGATGHIKLIDLGLSKNLEAQSGHCTSDDKLGTPDYMAPEVIRGQSYNTAVDMWAIGCIMYELYYGKPPFHSDTVDGIFDNILEGFQLNTGSGLDSLVSRLLSPDPGKRPTAEEVKDDPFFEGVVWTRLHEDYEPPFIPRPLSEDDTSYFSSCFKSESMIIELQEASPIKTVHNNDVSSNSSLSGLSDNSCNLLSSSPFEFGYKNLELLEGLNKRQYKNSSPLRKL